MLPSTFLSQQQKTILIITSISCLIFFEIFRVLHSINPDFFRDIDWHCYERFGRMFWESKNLDYSQYFCDFGRMYYPSTFIHIYSLIWGVSKGSTLIVQRIHALVQISTTLMTLILFLPLMIDRDRVVSSIFRSSFLFLVSILLCQTTYRLGLSYVTNDIFVCFFSVSMLLSIRFEQYWLSSLFFSLAASFKMNALFYGPALLLVYFWSMSFVRVVAHFSCMFLVMVVSALPFLLYDVKTYLSIAFNFGRDFDNDQNLAWSFLPEEFRTSKPFYSILLFCTIFFLGSFLYSRFKIVQKKQGKVTIEWKISTLVISNFICFCFSRGIHPQFSLWVFYSLPFIISRSARLGTSLVFSSILLLLFDFSVSYYRNVIHIHALPYALKALFVDFDFRSFLSLFNGRDVSFFGRLLGYFNLEEGGASTLSDIPHYNVLGWFYREPFSLWAIPSSFILFSIEMFVLWRVFREEVKTKTKIE